MWNMFYADSIDISNVFNEKNIFFVQTEEFGEYEEDERGDDGKNKNGVCLPYILLALIKSFWSDWYKLIFVSVVLMVFNLILMLNMNNSSRFTKQQISSWERRWSATAEVARSV